MKRIFALVIITAILLCGCSFGDTEPTSGTQLLFDTVVKIDLYDGGSNEILNGCFELCKKYESLFSTTVQTSDISRINAANGSPVTVSDETAELLKLALDYSAMSNGVFDISVYPLKVLWDFKADSPRVPDPDKIELALLSVDYRNVTVNGNTVTAKSGTMLDLGGIAKGYIADRIKEYLVSRNVGRAIINLGGNVLTVGEKKGGWKIGIKKPYTAAEILKTVSFSGGSVVTSGCYERYFEASGKRYHHILDTSTGYPVENGLTAVTIICESSALADFLSTAVYAMGYEDGLEFLKKTDAQAVFVFNDGSVKLSSGLNYKNGYIVTSDKV